MKKQILLLMILINAICQVMAQNSEISQLTFSKGTIIPIITYSDTSNKAAVCSADDNKISPVFLADGDTIEFSDEIVKGKEFHFTSTVDRNSEVGKDKRYVGRWKVLVKDCEGKYSRSQTTFINDKYGCLIKPDSDMLENCLIDTLPDKVTGYYTARIEYCLIDNTEDVVISEDSREIKVEMPKFPSKPVIKNLTFHSFEVDWDTQDCMVGLSFDIECNNAEKFAIFDRGYFATKPDFDNMIGGIILLYELPYAFKAFYLNISETETGIHVESHNSPIDWATVFCVKAWNEVGGSLKSDWIYTGDYVEPEMLELMRHYDDVITGIRTVDCDQTKPVRILKDHISCSDDVSEIRIYDINGNVLMNFGKGIGEITFSDFQPGIYILSYTTKNNITQNIKFVK